MTTRIAYTRRWIAAALLAVAGVCAAAGRSPEPTLLYIGDVGDNSVKRFDAASGAFVDTFVAPGAGGLAGPMGLFFRGGRLLLVNQNIGQPNNGEVLRFDRQNGAFIDRLVAGNSPDAPFAPRGMVRGAAGNVLYVADIGTASGDCSSEGRVARYNGGDGRFLGDLDRRGFAFEFHPRGAVFGPDGLLYVSAIGCPIPTDPRFDPLAGFVLRFEPRSGQFVDVFASNNSVPDLHRPEGLVFDADGNLWVASFRASPADSDRILKLDGKSGAQLAALLLAAPVAAGGTRAFAQAILFGPGGDLFIPISGGDPATAGEVRRCDARALSCKTLVPANSAGGPLFAPFYLIFEDSNPATLDFDD
jgi:DNA-binding beta-propeller fold protein YncE